MCIILMGPRTIGLCHPGILKPSIFPEVWLFSRRSPCHLAMWPQKMIFGVNLFPTVMVGLETDLLNNA